MIKRLPQPARDFSRWGKKKSGAGLMATFGKRLRPIVKTLLRNITPIAERKLKSLGSTLIRQGGSVLSSLAQKTIGQSKRRGGGGSSRSSSSSSSSLKPEGPSDEWAVNFNDANPTFLTPAIVHPSLDSKYSDTPLLKRKKKQKKRKKSTKLGQKKIKKRKKKNEKNKKRKKIKKGWKKMSD